MDAVGWCGSLLLGYHFQNKNHLYKYRDSYYEAKMRPFYLYNGNPILSSLMGLHMVVRWCLYIEMSPRCECVCYTPGIEIQTNIGVPVRDSMHDRVRLLRVSVHELGRCFGICPLIYIERLSTHLTKNTATTQAEGYHEKLGQCRPHKGSRLNFRHMHGALQPWYCKPHVNKETNGFLIFVVVLTTSHA